MRSRTTVELDLVMRWAPGVRLQFDRRRNCWALIAPERVLYPDGVALDIMQQIDGKKDVTAVVDALLKEYAADTAEMRADTLAFLQDLADRGYLTS